MSHTPGPWEYADAGSFKRGAYSLDKYFVRRPEDDVAIAADIIDPDTMQPSESNARLIAAAPDLLKACKAAIEWFIAYMPDAKVMSAEAITQRQLQIAIEKAEGE